MEFFKIFTQAKICSTFSKYAELAKIVSNTQLTGTMTNIGYTPNISTNKNNLQELALDLAHYSMSVIMHIELIYLFIAFFAHVVSVH